MKKIFIILLLATVTINAQTKFSNGYQKGYKDGYCYQDYGCLEPIPPLSPLPNINERSTSYKDGYQRGFLEGGNTKTKKENKKANISEYNKPRKYPNYQQVYDFELIEKSLRLKRQKRLRRSERKLFDSKMRDLKSAVTNSNMVYNEAIKYLNEYKDLILEVKILSLFIDSKKPTVITDRYLKELSLSVNDIDGIISELKENDRQINIKIVAKASDFLLWFYENPNKVILGDFNSNRNSVFKYNYDTKKYELKEVKESRVLLKFERNKFTIESKKVNKSMFIGTSTNKEQLGKVLEDGFGGIIYYDKKENKLYRFFDKDLTTNQYLSKTAYHNLMKLN